MFAMPMHYLRAAPQRLLIALLRGYRLLLSPWLGSQCRFEPTCSLYAIEALQRHGAAGGSYLAARRLLRCHPWCAGGCDTVPERLPHWSGRSRADPPSGNPAPSTSSKNSP
jgi:uncharacterized protein